MTPDLSSKVSVKASSCFFFHLCGCKGFVIYPSLQRSAQTSVWTSACSPKFVPAWTVLTTVHQLGMCEKVKLDTCWCTLCIYTVSTILGPILVKQVHTVFFFDFFDLCCSVVQPNTANKGALLAVRGSPSCLLVHVQDVAAYAESQLQYV